MSTDPTKAEKAIYSHGHHASVVSAHARRTAADSAAFLLPHIQPHHKILDLGCGPGTITADLAAKVPQGHIIGVDAVESVLSQARDFATSRGLTNITFQTGDANNLPFDDGEFDIVFCHQVLQHVKDPVGVLKEMRRVAKQGAGLVAAREADYSSFAWFPDPPAGEFRDWLAIYIKVARANGGEPDAGRYMLQWTRLAGWQEEQVTLSWSNWCYTKEKAKSWAESWTGRALHSGMAEGYLSRGFGKQEDLVKISEAWKKWGDGGFGQDLLMVIGNGEVLCRC